MLLNRKEINSVIESINSGKPVVLPTDTIYGIIASALNKQAVLNLYKLRKRNKEKPFIILISSIKDLSLFGINVDKEINLYLKRIWPNKITVMLECKNKDYNYLHRGKKTLAFRLPEDKWLRALIKKVGPIVVPSANLEGMPEARNVKEAYAYFGDKATYIDKGTIRGGSSTIISLVNNQFEIIRKGSYKIKVNEYFRSSINN